MCGISSIFRNDKVGSANIDKLAAALAWVGSIRGYDSTGMFYGGGDDMADHYKRAVSGWDFQYLPRVEAVLRRTEQHRYIVLHNRAATKGEVNNRNSHPFHIGEIVGVHNGTVTNHHGLSPQGFHHTVDSAHLLAAIEAEGSAKVIPRIQGSFNLIWMDNEDQTIHQVRNNDRPYVFAKLKDKEILVGASEKAMLKWLVSRHHMEIEYSWTPAPYVENVWSIEDDMITPAYTIEHEAYVPPKLPAPAKNGQTTTGGTGSSAKQPNTETIEFFFHTAEHQSHVTNGVVYDNLRGETVNGEEVIVYSVKQGKYELDKWYKAEAFATVAIATKENYYRISEATIVSHPTENTEDFFYDCIHCQEPSPMDETIFMDSNAVCVPCAHQLQVQVGDVDEGHTWKLYKQ